MSPKLSVESIISQLNRKTATPNLHTNWTLSVFVTAAGRYQPMAALDFRLFLCSRHILVSKRDSPRTAVSPKGGHGDRNNVLLLELKKPLG